MGCRLDSSGTELGPVAGSCEHSSEYSRVIRFLKFLTHRKNVKFGRIRILLVV